MLEREILEKYHNVAIVGLSPKQDKPSHIVGSYLAEHGYNIIPINPNASMLLGKTSYPDLTSVPEKIEIVDIFRRSEDVMPVVEDAIKVGAKVIWMQLDVVNEEAAARARKAGLQVVMNKCMKRMHEEITRSKRD